MNVFDFLKQQFPLESIVKDGINKKKPPFKQSIKADSLLFPWFNNIDVFINIGYRIDVSCWGVPTTLKMLEEFSCFFISNVYPINNELVELINYEKCRFMDEYWFDVSGKIIEDETIEPHYGFEFDFSANRITIEVFNCQNIAPEIMVRV